MYSPEQAQQMLDNQGYKSEVYLNTTLDPNAERVTTTWVIDGKTDPYARFTIVSGPSKIPVTIDIIASQVASRSFVIRNVSRETPITVYEITETNGIKSFMSEQLRVNDKAPMSPQDIFSIEGDFYTLEVIPDLKSGKKEVSLRLLSLNEIESKLY